MNIFNKTENNILVNAGWFFKTYSNEKPVFNILSNLTSDTDLYNWIVPINFVALLMLACGC